MIVLEKVHQIVYDILHRSNLKCHILIIIAVGLNSQLKYIVYCRIDMFKLTEALNGEFELGVCFDFGKLRKIDAVVAYSLPVGYCSHHFICKLVALLRKTFFRYFEYIFTQHRFGLVQEFLILLELFKLVVIEFLKKLIGKGEIFSCGFAH